MYALHVGLYVCMFWAQAIWLVAQGCIEDMFLAQGSLVAQGPHVNCGFPSFVGVDFFKHKVWLIWFC